MRPIRLAYLVGHLNRAGAELQMIALTERLTSQGFEVDFVIRGGPVPLADAARAAGATVRVLGEWTTTETPTSQRVGRFIGRNARWLALARHRRYDIVDAWLHPAEVVASITRPLTRVPVVMTARLGLGPRREVWPITGLLRAASSRLVDAVVANADATAEDAVDSLGYPAEKVRVIRGGVAKPRSYSATERAAVRARLGAGDGDVLIGCVGNFRPMKRQDLVIEAFAQLLTEYSQIRLALVGDGDLRPQIERQIDALGLAGRVVLYGTADDLPPLYDAFDLLVQASSSEGLPNVLLEASACGTAIVATAAGGSGEVIHDGQTGLLIPVDDAGRLGAAMRRMIVDVDLRSRLGAQARSAVEVQYGMERFANEYINLYREQLVAKAPRLVR